MSMGPICMRDVRDAREMSEREKEILATAVAYIKKIRQNCTPLMFEQFLTILKEWNNGQVGVIYLSFFFNIFFYYYCYIIFQDWY
jgi:hypothetical protein